MKEAAGRRSLAVPAAAGSPRPGDARRLEEGGDLT